MGFFQRLGSLVDQLVDWLGEFFLWFIEALVVALEKIWRRAVATALYAAFGAVSTLYVIYYASAALGETIMEVWDPKYYNTKPSKVFKLRPANKNARKSPLPTERSDAEVLVLENWR